MGTNSNCWLKQTIYEPPSILANSILREEMKYYDSILHKRFS
jgi:hypothetical protein